MNGKYGDNFLLTMRLLACLMWIYIEVPLILDKGGYLETFYKFYTNWTFYIWSVWLVCIAFSQVVY